MLQLPFFFFQHKHPTMTAMIITSTTAPMEPPITAGLTCALVTGTVGTAVVVVVAMSLHVIAQVIVFSTVRAVDSM